MEKASTKPWILWVGEHAYEEFKLLNTSITTNYEHLVLRYTRLDKATEDSSIYFLDEYTYLPEGSYLKEILSFPLLNWLKEKGIALQEGLIVGDASEVLMQTFISISTFPIPNEIQNEEPLFEAVYHLDTIDSKEWIDFSVYNLLFLKESIPFSDVVQEAEITKQTSLKGFNEVMLVNSQPFSINDFLYYYQDGLAEVIKSITSIKKYN
jgi:hypothetical protein